LPTPASNNAHKKSPRIIQGLFQFGVILYQPSGMASKQKFR
jgi:hypothetical protein